MLVKGVVRLGAPAISPPCPLVAENVSSRRGQTHTACPGHWQMAVWNRSRQLKAINQVWSGGFQCQDFDFIMFMDNKPHCKCRRCFKSLAPRGFDYGLKLVNFKLISTKYFLWNCYQVNAPTPHSLLVNIGSGNGLVPSGNKPLPEPMLT